MNERRIAQCAEVLQTPPLAMPTRPEYSLEINQEELQSRFSFGDENVFEIEILVDESGPQEASGQIADLRQ